MIVQDYLTEIKAKLITSSLINKIAIVWERGIVAKYSRIQKSGVRSKTGECV